MSLLNRTQDFGTKDAFRELTKMTAVSDEVVKMKEDVRIEGHGMRHPGRDPRCENMTSFGLEQRIKLEGQPCPGSQN